MINKKQSFFIAAILIGTSAVTYSCKQDNMTPSNTSTKTTPLQKILFVGDSFTHGRYTPVRSYNSGGDGKTTTGSVYVYDENYGQTGARAEKETGPWGGIPGIFAEFAHEAGLSYDVHIEAISETSLEKNFAAASGVIAQNKWNAVVLQELSTKPLPYSLTQDNTSDPSGFCGSVQTIEQAIHQAASATKVYLYETWPRADLASALSGGDPSAVSFSTSYAANLITLANANHNAYYSAVKHDGNIAGVAAAGEAWVNAWAAGIANPNPYLGTSNKPILWYGINNVNNPQITSPDYLHPGIYGAYLSGLVLFQKITGVDVRTLGAQESVASQFGIPGNVAVELQLVAWQTVTQENAQPINQITDPCTIKSKS